MGIMIDGQWKPDLYEMHVDQKKHPIHTIDNEIVNEPGRYHLYASKACPFAQRALIVRNIKELQSVSLSYVNTVRVETEGWDFSTDANSMFYDGENQLSKLRDLFEIYQPGYTGRVVVPLLWDKIDKKIVSTESSSIIKALNAFPGNDTDLYPYEHRQQIDELSGWVEARINFAVYGVGFSFDQAIYEKNVRLLFDALGEMNKRLSNQPFLIGENLTLVDIRLFTTLLRFDEVYHYHFKCSLKKIIDFPALQQYTQRLSLMSAIQSTIDMDMIKNHYYKTHTLLNPHGIIPMTNAYS